LDTHPLNITTLGVILCISGKKLYRWYKDVLSGFNTEEGQKELHRHDLKVEGKVKEKVISVPIVKPENIGKHMAIDEKQIGEEMHTIITNRETGKIALLAQTLKSSHLSEIMETYEEKGYEVETVTRDLSNSYNSFCKWSFPFAKHIADKFHILSQLLDAGQSVRVRYRQELLRKRRMAYEKHKQIEKERKKQFKLSGINYEPKKFTYQEKRFKNGDTFLELLARSRYLLYKYKHQWTYSQKERADILFEEFPEVKTAYDLACEFRIWYRKENVGEDRITMETALNRWYVKVEQAEIDEMLNFKSMVEINQNIIINYFDKGYTNAIAENMNSRIQRFIVSNQGTRDRDFFYFRVRNYFA